MKEIKELEFNNIIYDIIKNEEFIDLKYEIHHGISRLEHSLNVAKLVFKMCRFLGVERIEDTTRAALLHDFFKNDEVLESRFVNHPLKALENSKRVFDINDFQANIIVSHMFPLTKIWPKSKESLIVSLADKIIAIKECARYKVPLTIGSTFLFFMNFCIAPR